MLEDVSVLLHCTYFDFRERDQRYYDDSYRLLPQDENSDGEDGRSINLRPKRPTNHYIEHMLQSGDTLSSLALRYNCSVSDHCSVSVMDLK